jgi:CPA2 family monovalent cation:H+ antiporter-2
VRGSAVVVSFADTPKALAILAHVRELRPELPVIVRTFDDTRCRRLRDAGAAEIVAEVVEGSLMLATQTMMQLGVPLNRVLRRCATSRQERYQPRCAATSPAPPTRMPPTTRPRACAPSWPPRTRHASAARWGRTTSRASTCRVTAIRRPGEREVNPSRDTMVKAGDVLVLLGTQENLAKAEMRLLQG